jgi:hypothetical protein
MMQATSYQRASKKYYLEISEPRLWGIRGTGAAKICCVIEMGARRKTLLSGANAQELAQLSDVRCIGMHETRLPRVQDNRARKRSSGDALARIATAPNACVYGEASMLRRFRSRRTVGGCRLWVVRVRLKDIGIAERGIVSVRFVRLLLMSVLGSKWWVDGL